MVIIVALHSFKPTASPLLVLDSAVASQYVWLCWPIVSDDKIHLRLLILRRCALSCWYLVKMALYCPQGSGTLRQQLSMMHGIPWYCMVLNCIAWHCMALHGIAWFCNIPHGIACYCLLLHGNTWYCKFFTIFHDAKKHDRLKVGKVRSRKS